MLATIDGVVVVIETVTDLARLLRWGNRNRSKVIHYQNRYLEGVIEYGENGGYRQQFTVLNDGTVRLEQLSGRLQGLGFSYNRSTLEYINVSNIGSIYPIQHVKQDMVSIHATVMAIIQHAPEYVREDGNRILIKIEG